ncbi:hypothetical protein [Rhizobium aegyptiacum]|uniref:hypothetical protein n=1 Tax=Rhizobium aegyptiacum TaxID=1764550 RepID=UPI0012E97E93|nr:hypothetical protein [Rhizobium aegyptiacum]
MIVEVGINNSGLSQISALNGMLTIGREIPAPDVVERTDGSEIIFRPTLQLLGNGIQNHRLAPQIRSENFSGERQQTVN